MVAGELVTFSLLCKLQDCLPYTLLTVQGTRLKQIRFHCYQKALEQLASGALNPPIPPVFSLKKKRAPVPISF
ncbi:MAG: hypothetical protein NTV00_03295 [Methylococcales bacterium]|nr:hypothetical protein [Methylococcales bacterium]